MRKLELTEKRFGKLVVLEETISDKKVSKWLCQCDCGNKKICVGWHLTAGKINSCGCIKRNDRIGQKIGYWKVLEYAGKERWLCECRCGTTKKVTSTSLVRNKSLSCGCYKSPNELDYHEKIKKRILSYVNFNDNGCWDWIGYKDSKGYGSMTYRKKTGQVSSRISYIVWKGEIPEGIFVLHKCDRPCCVNPDHLFLGTHEDNMRDMKEKGRACKGEANHLHKKNRLKNEQ